LGDFRTDDWLMAKHGGLKRVGCYREMIGQTGGAKERWAAS
jgi:hypothetical protein